MIESDDILAEVERFLARHGIGTAAFGRAVMNDPNFVPDLRAGRDIRRSTVARLRVYMRSYPPARRRDRGNASAAAA